MRTRNAFIAAALFLLAVPCAAQEAGPAGEVRAMRPDATIESGGAAPAAAAVNAPIHWRDWFATGEAGRGRLAMNDGTVINVGSAARVQVNPTEQATQTGEILLQAGKVRAWVLEKTDRPQILEIRTSAAVVGVIGTHAYVEIVQGATKVINIGGILRVHSPDPGVQGEVQLNAFEAIAMEPGKAPGEKRKATWDEIYRAILDTMPGATFEMWPSQGRAGRCTTVNSTQELPASLPMGALEAPHCPNPEANAAQLCLPKDAEPGIQELSMPGPGGETLWSAFLVYPPAGKIQDSDGAEFLAPSAVAPGTTVTAYLLNDGKPVVNAPVQVTQEGRTSHAYTNASGSITLRIPQEGAVELVTRPASLLSPIPLPEVHGRIFVDAKMKSKDQKLPEVAQVGEPILINEDVQKATLNGKELPVARVIGPDGAFMSLFRPPYQVSDKSGTLEYTTANGEKRTEQIAFYEIVGGDLNQRELLGGAETDGRFEVCIRDASVDKIKAKIHAYGPVRFRGKGSKGERFETRLIVQGGAVVKIPFRLQAEKTGIPTGVPFALVLQIERD